MANKKMLFVIVGIAVVILAIGAFYVFGKSATSPNTTTTATTGGGKTVGGLSSLLGNLNLSGLNIF